MAIIAMSNYGIEKKWRDHKDKDNSDDGDDNSIDDKDSGRDCGRGCESNVDMIVKILDSCLLKVRSSYLQKQHLKSKK